MKEKALFVGFIAMVIAADYIAVFAQDVPKAEEEGEVKAKTDVKAEVEKAGEEAETKTVAKVDVEAEKKVEAKAEAKVEPLWSLGAGVGFAVYSEARYLSGHSGLTPSYGFVSPWGTILVERRLSRKIAIPFSIYGTYVNYDVERPEGLISVSVEDAYFVNCSIGARWIFNPDGAVEVSAILSPAVSWESSRGTALESPDDGAAVDRVEANVKNVGYSVGLRFGLAVERKLLDNLYLRLETPLLQGHYGATETTTRFPDGNQESDRGDTFGIGLLITPTLQLRLAF